MRTQTPTRVTAGWCLTVAVAVGALAASGDTGDDDDLTDGPGAIATEPRETGGVDPGSGCATCRTWEEVLGARTLDELVATTEQVLDQVAADATDEERAELGLTDRVPAGPGDVGAYELTELRAFVALARGYSGEVPTDEAVGELDAVRGDVRDDIQALVARADVDLAARRLRDRPDDPAAVDELARAVARAEPVERLLSADELDAYALLADYAATRVDDPDQADAIRADLNERLAGDSIQPLTVLIVDGTMTGFDRSG